MMKVTLVNPPLKDCKIKSILKNLFYNSPPLGLCYIAAVLKKANIDARIIDAAVEGVSFERVIERLKGFNPDIIGITSTTYSFPFAVILGREIKKRLKDKKVFIGGPHITSNPEDILKYECFDFGVLGEGENTCFELVTALRDGKDIFNIAGLAFNRDGKIYLTARRPLIEDLDTLPFPDRDLLPLGLYRPQPNDWNVLPKMSMITSRGCPYGCIFCDKSVFGQSYRSFSPKYIVSEMKLLVDKYGAKDIAFVDSTFTLSVDRVRGIIQEMNKQKVKVNWTCTVRANIVTYELLKEMKESGCWRVRIGVESANDEVLRFIKKRISKEQVLRVVRLADKLGLQPKGFFSIGHLIDTKETIRESIRFAKSAPFKDITVQINTPLKNTPQYDIYKNYGVLADEDRIDYSFWQPAFIARNITKRELLSLHRKFYRDFYCRYVTVWRHIKEIRNIKDLKKYLKSFDLLFHLFFGRI